MKHFSKKRTGIVTLLIMCAVLFGFGAAASADDVEELTSGYCGDNMTYTLTSDGVLTISGYGEMYNSVYSVLGYDDWASYADLIESIVFESNTSGLNPGITSIGQSAFYSYKSLKSVDLPATLETIGSSAFYYCTSLTSVTLPATLETIGDNAFDGCSSLLPVTLPEGLKTIGSFAFSNCDALYSVEFPASLESIGFDAYSNCDLLTSVTFPAGITTIGYDAFKNCSALESINFLGQVESIDHGAFSNCDALTSVTFAEGPETIEWRAFFSCDALQYIEIPEGTTTIGDGCFEDCSMLTNISMPDSIVSFGHDVFKNTNWYTKQPNAVYAGNVFYGYKSNCPETVVIKDGTVCIAGYAFKNTSTVKTVIIPDTVKGISQDAFDNCDNLLYVKMSENTEFIGDAAFRDCPALTGIRVVGNNAYISDNAFSSCTGLKDVALSGTLEYVGKNAFSSCSSINDVYYGSGSYEWGFVYIYENNDYLVNADIHYSTDPDITALAVSDASAVLDIGDTQYIAAIPTSAAAKNTAVWTSSDTSVATVEDGCITAVSPGFAVITASIGSLTAQCEVYVTEPDEEAYPYTIVATSIKTAGGEECEAIPDGAFYAEVTVSETTERESNDYFVAAAYSSDGALVDIKYIYTNVCDEPLSVGFYFSNAAYVKFFVWDALGTMTPLAETAEII